MPAYRLLVNGSTHTIDAEPGMPLLWVLRDRLGLLGTKYGCGVGICGACTVHLDGQPARSCLVPVAAVGMRPVVTIEGLTPNGDHPLQTAWVAESVPQCGYCQAGQIMQAAALLARQPSPSDQEIGEAMAGNLCRCGTYGRIRRAIRRAATDLSGSR